MFTVSTYRKPDALIAKCLLTRSVRSPDALMHLWTVHVIPKPDEKQGLGVGWPAMQPAKEELANIHEKIKGRLEKL